MSGSNDDFDYTGAIFDPTTLDQTTAFDPTAFDATQSPFLGATTAQPVGNPGDAPGTAPTGTIAGSTMATPPGSPLDWATPAQLQAAGLGGSGQTGDFSAKLKTALSGLQGFAKTQAAADAQTQKDGWPFGQPRAGVATQSRGTQSSGLADMINTLRQRQQQLQTSYLNAGNLAPRGPGGGLLGF
jgi:hypothetical protein